jgi:peptide/nickel transport system substrate-binding protein
MKKWLVLLLAISVISMLLISACSSSTTSSSATTTKAPTATTTTTAPKPTATPTTTTSAPATSTAGPGTNPAAKYGGIFKVLTILALTNVGDPGKDLPLADTIYSQPACEYLTSRDNQNASVIPALATAWQPSPDNKSITFTLRKGVKFHDGTVFDATAAKFSLDLALNGKLASIANVSSVDVVDASTIKVNLKQIDLFILQGDIRVIMVSPTSYAKLGNDAMFHAVGTGPYKFVSYTPSVKLVYQRNDDYWKGKPYLDTMEFDFIANETTQMAAFKAGDGDAVIRISEQPISMLKPLKFQINTAPTAAWGIIYNSKDPASPFSNLKVRQAVSYAIDASATAKAQSFGADSYVNQFSARPEVPGTTYNSNVAGYPFSVDKAKQLLKEAGYTNGFNTKLFYLNVPDITNLSTTVAGYLDAVGIKVVLDAGDPARWAKETRSEFTGMAPFFISVNPLENMANQFYYQLGGIGADAGGRWPVATIPADYLALVKQVAAEPDAVKRTALFQQMNKMIIDTYCLATPIYVGVTGAAFNPLLVHDFDVSVLNATYWHPELVWVSK